MAAKILFTHSYFYRLDKKQWQNQRPYPPYGTILAAANCRSMGHQVALFDSGLQYGPEQLATQLQAFQPDFLVIYDDSFNYLSKMCLSVMREAALKMIVMAKAQGVRVFVSSSDATDHPEIYLKAGANLVMLGEADQTLREVIQHGGHASVDCLGIAYLENGSLLKTPRRPVLQDLDSIPDPAWDLVSLDDYRDIWMRAHGYFSLNIATTRGCPFKCNWCAKPIYGNRYNSRSPERVAEELSLLMVKYKATHFWVCDDIFGLKPGWMDQFSELLQEKQLKPKLKIQCRADLLLKPATVESLVKAGLDEVWIGAESGSQKILDAMDKGITVPQIHQANQLLTSMGVKVCLFIQYGYLDEQKEDIQKTLEMIRAIDPYDIGISVSYPLPGTGFHKKVQLLMLEKQNWKDSNDLETLYRTKFSKDFYKQLHLYTHYCFKNWKSGKAIMNHFIRKAPSGQLLKDFLHFNHSLANRILSKLKLSYHQLH